MEETINPMLLGLSIIHIIDETNPIKKNITLAIDASKRYSVSGGFYRYQRIKSD